MSNGSEKKYSGAEAEEINNYLNTHVLQLENNLEIVRSFDVDEENK
jgi:hypothetical protein